ncbi:MAG: oxidoreductase [Acidimicrobiales bacterium]
MSEDPQPAGPFRAFVVDSQDGVLTKALTTLTVDDLDPAGVLVRVAFSSVNYKDGLAVLPGGRVARISPLVPGIDLVGEVVSSPDPEVAAGCWVVAHGYELGASHHGGFAEYASVPPGWLVPLPEGLSPRQAMIIGTAGYTAALSVLAIEERGLEPGGGPVLVTGASGGVGSTAVAILSGRGHEVVASTGKAEAGPWLRSLGASEVLGREEVSAPGDRPLGHERWAGAVDCVGGATLACILRTLRRAGTVAASGLTGGSELPTTVFPFIIRGVALVGIDSVGTPVARRREIWSRLAGDLRPAHLEELATEVDLADVTSALDAVLAGKTQGRTVVRVGPPG